ncbi:MAG: alginate export family protein [Gammaproteobacteria bacterium]|nr:alginate export family protein [Gammaproteobacteria bacterium]MDH3450599.1 alginate export family protein [Gammaproteobacteria bacterium]
MKYPALLAATFLALPVYAIAAGSAGDSRCWSIQLGAFSEIANATQRLDSLGSAQCRVVSATGRHRVLCECFDSHDLASQSIARWQVSDPGAFVIDAAAFDRVGNGGIPFPVSGHRNMTVARIDLPQPGLDAQPDPPRIDVASAAINPRGIDYLDRDAAAAQSEFSDLTGVEKAKVLRQRPYERIPQTEFSIELFGRLLTLGGELSLETEARRDYALATEPDDLDRNTLELELEFFYPFSDYSAAFVELEGVHRTDRETETDEDETESDWSRDEMWYYSGGWFEDSFGIQIGRQNFADERTWWWDRNLDAVRLHYDTATLHLEVAIARELARVSTNQDGIDPEEDKLLRLISTATWVRDKDHLGSIFLLLQSDGSNTETAGTIVRRESRDKVDLDAIWIGARRQGKYRFENSARLYYWIDLGLVAGTEKIIDYDAVDPRFSLVDSVSERDLRGAALDLGGTWRTGLAGGMTFSLAYAVGSGDSNPGDDTDTAYRQSGLNRNDDKFRGVNDFHYYGDLLRPELSNIAITTLGWGFHFFPESSFDLVFHSYRQLEAADEIRGSRLDIDPLGNSRQIGAELDLIVGIEEWKQLEIDLVLSRFRAGRAFGNLDGEVASRLSFELTYNF